MNRQDAVDDRDLDRWVQEVTDDWRQPALRVGQPSWQHRVVQPSGRSFHGLTTARRAAVGLAGVALVGIVAVALLLSSQILVPGGQPNGVGAVAATDLAATDGPTKTAAPSAAGPTEPTTTEPPPTDPSATDAPAVGIARDPLFHLTIESDRARYAAGEPIAAAFSAADRRAAGKAAVEKLVERFVEDESLSEDEERELVAAVDRLGLTEDDFLATLRSFGNRVAIARMAAGRLSQLTDPAIMLKPREAAHLQVAAKMMKEVLHRETRGGFSGVSIPIAKGVRFRTGSYRGRSVVVGTSLEVADEGVLCITSKRAVFKGLRQSAEFSFAKLLGLNVFDDGIQFHVSNRKTAPLFRVSDGYLVAAAVNAVVQRLV